MDNSYCNILINSDIRETVQPHPYDCSSIYAIYAEIHMNTFLEKQFQDG